MRCAWPRGNRAAPLPRHGPGGQRGSAAGPTSFVLGVAGDGLRGYGAGLRVTGGRGRFNRRRLAGTQQPRGCTVEASRRTRVHRLCFCRSGQPCPSDGRRWNGRRTCGRTGPSFDARPPQPTATPGPGASMRPGPVPRAAPLQTPGAEGDPAFGGKKIALRGGGGMAQEPICPNPPPPPPWSPCREGVWAGAALPAVPGGGGGGPIPTYMAQNDPHVALIILTTHMWGKIFS